MPSLFSLFSPPPFPALPPPPVTPFSPLPPRSPLRSPLARLPPGRRVPPSSLALPAPPPRFPWPAPSRVTSSPPSPPLSGPSSPLPPTLASFPRFGLSPSPPSPPPPPRGTQAAPRRWASLLKHPSPPRLPLSPLPLDPPPPNPAPGAPIVLAHLLPSPTLPALPGGLGVPTPPIVFPGPPYLPGPLNWSWCGGVSRDVQLGERGRGPNGVVFGVRAKLGLRPAVVLPRPTSPHLPHCSPLLTKVYWAYSHAFLNDPQLGAVSGEVRVVGGARANSASGQVPPPRSPGLPPPLPLASQGL